MTLTVALLFVKYAATPPGGGGVNIRPRAKRAGGVDLHRLIKTRNQFQTFRKFFFFFFFSSNNEGKLPRVQYPSTWLS